MSHLPPGPAGVCSPEPPRACTPNLLAKSSSWCGVSASDRSGRRIMAEARSPVPTLLGQVWIYPKWSSNWKPDPSPSKTERIFSMPFDHLVNMPTMSPPSSIEMILMWSSSFTHTKNFLLSAQKMPLLSGQSLPAPAAARSAGPVGSWNRFPLPRSSLTISSGIDDRG